MLAIARLLVCRTMLIDAFDNGGGTQNFPINRSPKPAAATTSRCSCIV